MEKVHALKGPKTFTEQLDLLKKRGLLIQDDDFAIEILKTTNYYRLSAYGLTFQETEGTFSDSSSFIDILSLYQFDQKLRRLLLTLLEDVEITLRTSMAYVIGHRCGPLGYADGKNFKDADYHQKMMAYISAEIERSREIFIKHHRVKYGGHVPVWVVVEVMSFGALSKMLKNLQRPIAKKIADDFYDVPYHFVINWIHGLSIVRNVCAHYGRIYDRPFSCAMSLLKSQRQFGIPKRGLFSYLMPLGRLLRYSDMWFEAVASLENLFKEHPQVNLTCIGFPSDWKRALELDADCLTAEAAAAKLST